MTDSGGYVVDGVYNDRNLDRNWISAKRSVSWKMLEAVESRGDNIYQRQIICRS